MEEGLRTHDMTIHKQHTSNIRMCRIETNTKTYEGIKEWEIFAKKRKTNHKNKV